MPEPLFFCVGLDKRDPLGRATGELEVAQGLVIDREDGTRRAVLGAHVADGGAVGERHVGDARTVELDELPDDAMTAQHLGDGKNEVRGRRSVGQHAREFEADDARDQHADRLAEHRGFGFDAANTPPEHREPVDHRRVRIGADQCVGVRNAVAVEDDPREVFEIDLMADAGVGRHHLEVGERALPPAQELVALGIALELQLGVAHEGVLATEDVGDHAVVDHQFGRAQRIDPLGIAAERDHRLTHRSEVDDTRDAGEVLHEHPRRGELNFGVGLTLRVPPGERAHVVGGDVGAVFGAQQILEQHLQRERQAPRARHFTEAEDLVRRRPDLQAATTTEAVQRLPPLSRAQTVRAYCLQPPAVTW